jgi:ABC-type nitrate/sulfonate/bicarbonate transport system permease component
MSAITERRSALRLLDNDRFLKCLGVALFFGMWEFVPWLMGADPFVLPPPSLILETLWVELSAGNVLEHLLITTVEYTLALVFASIIGITIGMIAGRVRVFDYATEPFVWFLYSTPLIAIYPILILLVGLGFGSVLLIAFLLAVVPVIINTTVGVKNVHEPHVRLGRAFMASRSQMLKKVILPGSFPLVLAGIRLATGRALIGVVLGEMFGANSGIGFRIAESAARIRVPEVFAYLLVIVAFGVIVTQAFSAVESRLLRYQAQAR